MRCLHLHLLCFLIIFAGGLAFAEEPALIRAGELAHIADLIVIGTVTGVTTHADYPPALAGEATVRVERTIKGKTTTALTVRFPAPARGEKGMLYPTQQSLLFLQMSSGGGCTPIQGAQGIRPTADADAVARMVAAQPVEISIGTPVAPFYFGNTASVPVTVKNITTFGWEMTALSFEGIYLSPRMGHSVPFDWPHPAEQLALISRYQLLNLQAGASGTTNAAPVCEMPPSWEVFDANTYLQTPILVRAVVRVRSAARLSANPINYDGSIPVASPWVPATIGFAPPKDDLIPVVFP